MDFIPHGTLTETDAVYPTLLRDAGIKSSLYTLGNFDFSVEHTYVGVIGCRKPSVYGQVLTQKLVAELVYHKCVIVSGFMYGIDYEAHTAAVDCGGQTICVLGYGFSHLANTVPPYLIERFASSGSFVSEYEYNITPKKWTFVQRNKIIAGFCSLLLVIEAEQKSGSFITCNWAKKFGRQVYAVPGSILSEKSLGTNNLIKQGDAHMLTSISELGGLVRQNMSIPTQATSQTASTLAEHIIAVLSSGPLGFDVLYTQVNAHISCSRDKLIQTLSHLVLNRQILQQGSFYYVS